MGLTWKFYWFFPLQILDSIISSVVYDSVKDGVLIVGVQIYHVFVIMWSPSIWCYIDMLRMILGTLHFLFRAVNGSISYYSLIDI